VTADLAADGGPAVSVIMPTRAARERADSLRRAIGSALAQEEVRARPIVVVNGPDADPDLCGELAADARLRVIRLTPADLPAAFRAGRAAVDAPWFTTLDDDDLFLPGALAERIAALRAAPDHQAVVTNGIRRGQAGDVLQVLDPDAVRRDPVRALLRRHWLLPGSYLCRSDQVGAELFAGMPKFLENTYLALRLALDYRFLFLDRPTVVRHLDTPRSESKSRPYLVGQIEALRRLLELALPADVRREFERRVADVCHDVSGDFLRQGAVAAAWGWHWRSLRERSGWRYLPYTRWLVRAWWSAK
jgi:hypothetical protein